MNKYDINMIYIYYLHDIKYVYHNPNSNINNNRNCMLLFNNIFLNI